MASDHRYISGPEVYNIGQTEINPGEMRRYLTSIGADSYAQDLAERQALDILATGGELVMFGGKLCYKSWEPELNPNVTKVRDDPEEYLGNIISSGHGSVTEHASYNFIFQDVSRVFTHELVRHRHEAISQESMRYVRTEELRFWLPDILQPLYEEGAELLEQMEKFQIAAIKKLKLDEMTFADKKLYTSALRRFLPIGIATNLMWSANVRSLRHIIEMRTSPHAEIEIRNVFRDVGQIMKDKEPELFQDFELITSEEDPCGAWVSRHQKI